MARSWNPAAWLSWQEWLAVALVTCPPYIVGWWSLVLLPLIVALVVWGSSRRLDDARSTWWP